MATKAKKADSVEATDKLVSKFLQEGTIKVAVFIRVPLLICHIEIPQPPRKRSRLTWRSTPIPQCVKVGIILTNLRVEKPVSTDSDEHIVEDFKLSLNDSEAIETIRKESVFSEEVTESEMEVIQKRVAFQQRQFAQYERREKMRKSAKIRAMFDYICDEEIDEMLLDCEQDEDEVIVRLTKQDYLQSIRRIIASKYADEVETQGNVMDDEQKAAYQQLLKKRSETLKKTSTDQAKKQYRMGGRLALDDALKQVRENKVDLEKAFEGWSQARIRAYQMIDQNPNSYYYRFNAPGEEQRKGQWTEPEKKVFYKRLEEVGANGQWGIFSMSIPGRVGYQCSNFYRLLVETKQIIDPNYVLDEKGKAHYLFDKKNSNGEVEKTFRTHSKHGGGASESPRPRATRTRAAPSTAEKKTKKRKRRGNRWDSDDDDESDDFEDYNDNSGTYTMSNWGTTKRTRTRASTRNTSDLGAASEGSGDMDQDEDDEEEDELDFNPLPGFVDPITLDEVVKPAISKYGHVMGYDSWVRCLTNWEGKRNICPLTKKPLTKRDLVILDHENIEEYRSQIVNL
ncbi:hypothetical protein VKS41_003768 [Umbelopsis sp. WA50703]